MEKRRYYPNGRIFPSQTPMQKVLPEIKSRVVQKMTDFEARAMDEGYKRHAFDYREAKAFGEGAKWAIRQEARALKDNWTLALVYGLIIGGLIGLYLNEVI